MTHTSVAVPVDVTASPEFEALSQLARLAGSAVDVAYRPLRTAAYSASIPGVVGLGYGLTQQRAVDDLFDLLLSAGRIVVNGLALSWDSVASEWTARGVAA